MLLPLGIENKLKEAFTPPTVPKSWIDELIEEHDTENELWRWESMIVYHLKIDIEEIQAMSDDKFFDVVSRLRWVIEQEQKRNQATAGM